MRNDWDLIRKIKGGHSYWRRTDGAIGICDNSGSYPENCEPVDNPPLLLDTSRPIIIGNRNNFIPVKHENRQTSTTVACGFEALWVAAQFCMTVEVREQGALKPWYFTMPELET